MSGVPMNMEEWQRRMRAEKEAERQKKMQSAEYLQGYRHGGMTEEDKKLKAMREAERQKQLDAQQKLREYRGGEEAMAGTARKTSERPQQPQHPIPPSVQREADPLQQIAPGSVSAKAAHLMASLSPPTNEPETVGARFMPATTNGTTNNGTSVEAGAPPEQANGMMPTMDNGSAAAAAAAAPAEPMMMPASTDPAMAAPAAAMETATDQQMDSNPFEQATAMAPVPAVVEEPTIAPPSASEPMMVPPPPAGEPTMAAPPPPPAAPAPMMAASSDPFETTTTATTEEPMVMMAAAAPPAATPEPVRIVVSFGVVTDSANPNLAAYMSALQQILLSSQIQSSSPPQVTNQQWDATFVDPAGRSHVRRVLVTAAIPIVLSQAGAAAADSAAAVKQGIVHQLQTAIASGSLLQLVQQQQQQQQQQPFF